MPVTTGFNGCYSLCHAAWMPLQLRQNLRCERTQHDFAMSELGSLPTFAAPSMNGSSVLSARASSVPIFGVSTLDALANVRLGR
ncbi:hypothetical protein DSM109990_02451 [Sulfitobacter dubius]|uniref:Uncharacterized protein n=1 Tax=Sulfitobacter dubius TaxID=218673 RepID=A0ABY3ZS35_9RHOB|nr:hypothetical protein DSM109990_02451 [Sulfitobacter dubius]